MIDFNARTGIITATTFSGGVSGSGASLTDIPVTGLADGTDGELITWSAAGVATTVGVGTLNQVLTSGGAGVAPTFEDAAGGGDPDQNIWLNMDADSGGPIAANTTSDTFTITGSTGITTAISGDSVTIAVDEPVPTGSTTSQVLEWNGSAWAVSTDLILTAGLPTFKSIGNDDPTVPDALSLEIQLHSADDNVYAEIGYASSIDFQIFSRSHGGSILLRAEDTAGSLKTGLTIDPDAITTLTGDTQVVIEAQGNTGLSINTSGQAVLSNSGTSRFHTNTFGAVRLLSDGATDAEARKIQYCHSNGTVRFELGHLADTDFYFSSLMHGGSLIFQAEDDGGTPRTLITADPEAGVVMRYAGTTRLQTTSAGISTVGDVDIVTGSIFIDDNESINFGTTGASGDAQLFSDGTDVVLQLTAANNVDFTIQGGSSGSERMLECLDDGAVSIYHNGTSMIATQSNVTNTSGAFVRANNNSTPTTKDVGFNTLDKQEDNPASVTLDYEHCGAVIFADDNTAFTITVEASGGSTFPIGGMTTIINANSSVALTIADNSTIVYYMDGASRTDIGATGTLAAGGVANIWREAAGVYYLWGTGITV